MKKSTFTLLFSLLLIGTCLLASCNTNESIFGDPVDTPNQSTESSGYEGMIRDLENKIIELQQSHYISNATNRQELDRLQELVSSIQKDTETPEQTPTEPEDPKDEDKEDTQPPTENGKFLDRNPTGRSKNEEQEIP